MIVRAESAKGCERTDVELSCPGETVISVTSAVYKKQDESGPPDEECEIRTYECDAIEEVNDADVLQIVRDECDGLSTCVIYPENDFFGGADPCKGHRKYFGAEWTCIGDGDSGDGGSGGGGGDNNGGRLYGCFVCALLNSWRGVLATLVTGKEKRQQFMYRFSCHVSTHAHILPNASVRTAIARCTE